MTHLVEGAAAVPLANGTARAAGMRDSPAGSDLFTVGLADETIRQVTHAPGDIGSPDW